MTEKPKTSEHEVESSAIPPLPRVAWNSELTKLKVILKAKLALDRQEKAFLSQQSISKF